MSNTPTTDPVQTDFEGEEMRAELVAFFQDGLSHVSWWTAATSEEIASALLRGPLAQLQADLIAVRAERDRLKAKLHDSNMDHIARDIGDERAADEIYSLRLERDAFEQEVKGLRERLEELQGAPATPSGSQASPEAPSDLRPEGFDPSRTPVPHMEGLWPRRPNPTRHPDGSAMFYDIPWIKDWRTVTGRTLKEGMEAHRRALHGLVAYGCWSTVSPCSHQRRDPYSLCLTCQSIADQDIEHDRSGETS